MTYEQTMKKSAVGGTSVTLVAEPKFGEPHPVHLAATSIVVNFPGAPPAAFWGTGITAVDGIEFDVLFRRRS